MDEPFDPAASGLSTAQARERQAADGPNTLPGEAGRTWRHMAVEMLREPMFSLLVAASLLYLLLGDLQEGLILACFVQLILGLTLYQEGKTERALQALRDLSSPRARVVRDGQAQWIAGRDLVCGDVLLLAEGDRIAADAVLLSAQALQVDESLLTGESVPVHKLPVQAEVAALGQAMEGQLASEATDNRLYAGTLVVQGTAVARVCATGLNTQMGQIGVALKSVHAEDSPLRLQTARLVRRLAWIGLCLSLCLVLIQGLIHGDWLRALLSGIALAMAMLPEEFMVVMTVLPALGAWRLSREQVLTRRIAALETLGATSVLCVDKTGTLTQNRMSVAQLHAQGQRFELGHASELPEAFHALVEYAILASEADPFDPMEQAFHRLGQTFLAETEHLHRDWVLAHAYSLTPQLRAMAQVWQARTGEAHVVAAKGSPEAVADLCHLDPRRQQEVSEVADAMAAQGLRVLAVARAVFRGPPWPAEEHDFDFEWVGLLGLADPLRAEIPQAVQECQQAGIRVVMITGDYPVTAQAIARQAGLPAGQVLSGTELSALSDAELRQRLRDVHICARIAPSQKLRIVQALQADGAVVVMTGDGVNDAPALKAAHVGVAMGARGTDVAREAASVVLLDDNFASIVRAVRLGRRIFDNLRKSMSYIMAVHIPIAGAALLPLLLGWPAVLFPMHIALLELVIDPACSLVFENEPSDPQTMQRPPRDPQAALLGGWPLFQAMFQGLGVLLAVMTVQALGPQGLAQLDEAQTRALAFTTLVLGNLALILSNRGGQVALWYSLRVPNRMLLWVAGLTLGLLLLVLYVPLLSQALSLAPLSPALWGLAFAGMLFCLFWFELPKVLSRRR